MKIHPLVVLPGILAFIASVSMSWSTNSSFGYHLTYDGYDPVHKYTFTSTGGWGSGAHAEGFGHLEEELFNIHWNYKVETKARPIAANLMQINIKLIEIK